MVQRFGIQDHSIGIGSTRSQNPTNSTQYASLGGGGGFAARTTYSGGGGGVAVYGAAHAGPRTKGIVAAVLLALVFGPLGLCYTTRRGGLAVLGLLILGGLAHGGVRALSNDAVMSPLWMVAVAASTIWTIIAAKAHNIKALAEYAKKEKEKAAAPSG